MGLLLRRRSGDSFEGPHRSVSCAISHHVGFVPNISASKSTFSCVILFLYGSSASANSPTMNVGSPTSRPMGDVRNVHADVAAFRDVAHVVEPGDEETGVEGVLASELLGEGVDEHLLDSKLAGVEAVVHATHPGCTTFFCRRQRPGVDLCTAWSGRGLRVVWLWRGH